MRTIEKQIFKFNELKKEVKEKVISDWYEKEDYPLLSDDLTESCRELLKQKKIKFGDDLKLYYSLSCCQGDGLCFVGRFYWKQYRAEISHSHRYYYANSVDIEVFTVTDNDAKEFVCEEFKKLYLSICNQLEKEGYGILEYRMDEKEFAEHCEGNDYEFYANGEMF